MSYKYEKYCSKFILVKYLTDVADEYNVYLWGRFPYQVIYGRVGATKDLKHAIKIEMSWGDLHLIMFQTGTQEFFVSKNRTKIRKRIKRENSNPKFLFCCCSLW